MPTIARQPKAKDPANARRIAGARLGDVSMVGAAAPPPEVLLPSGGFDHRGHDVRPAWASASFQRRVGRFRRQLAPLRTQAALIASYGREAGLRSVDGRPPAVHRPTPLQVAYALRWLELARPMPIVATWADLLDGPLE